MTYKAIDVRLFRCDKCHTVQAVDIVQSRGLATTNKETTTCICGNHAFTRIAVAW